MRMAPQPVVQPAFTPVFFHDASHSQPPAPSHHQQQQQDGDDTPMTSLDDHANFFLPSDLYGPEAYSYGHYDLDMPDLGGGPPLDLDISGTLDFLTPVFDMDYAYLPAPFPFLDGADTPPADPAESDQPPPVAPSQPPAISLAAGTWSTQSTAPVVSNPVQTVNPAAVSQQLQQLQDVQDDNEDGDDLAFQGAHPVALSNPNPHSILGPENYGLRDFLRHWALSGQRSSQGHVRGRAPSIRNVLKQSASPAYAVRYADLQGERCDLQGIDWEHLGVTRSEARERRLNTYKNYVNKAGSDKWHPMLPDVILPRRESYFRFRRMDIRRNVHLAHFQLRNVLACVSRSQAFYPGTSAVHEMNPVSGESRVAIDLGETTAIQISTLAARHGVLIAGGFNGEYCLRRLGSEDGHVEGQLTSHTSAITNHVQVHTSRRSSAPLAAFASNDQGFRVLDIATGRFVSENMYDFPLNCSAISPDGRLRVMVGDHCSTIIASAETGEVLQELAGHLDYGFACDWSDDGRTVATGFQDKAVKIWDARRWTDSRGRATPLCTTRSEMAGARSLRFSPLGSGSPVLVAAEEADYLNIMDARTFRSKQTLDIFGEIGGVDFVNEGRDLMVLCCDRNWGGLLQLERCDLGIDHDEDDDDDDYRRVEDDDDGRRGVGDLFPSFAAAARDSWRPRRSGGGGGARPSRARRRHVTLRERQRAAWLEEMEPF